jgi:hypothetical protein
MFIKKQWGDFVPNAINIFYQEKNYLRLFLAGIVNGIGDRFSQVALLALLLELTGSGLVVGIALAIRVVPFLLWVFTIFCDFYSILETC